MLTMISSNFEKLHSPSVISEIVNEMLGCLVFNSVNRMSKYSQLLYCTSTLLVLMTLDSRSQIIERVQCAKIRLILPLY